MYAESVAMTGYAMDASTTFDVRIARFPESGRGSLWFYLYFGGVQYALVDDSVTLTSDGVTVVASADASFAVAGTSTASLTGTDRHRSGMQGRLQARGHLHRRAHPDPGQGEVLVQIEAAFEAGHEPIRVRPGRIEVMGRVAGVARIESEVHDFDLPGKWHEQTGERPAFAPAFTYLFVQGMEAGLMVTRHARGAWGYVFRQGTTVAVTGLEIEPYGSPRRSFTATLEDGSIVRGRATVVREVSVPIEGRRRPGATVLVESDLGAMVGVLNDWRGSTDA